MGVLDPLGVIFLAKDLASTTIKKLEGNFLSLDKTVQASSKNFSQGLVVMGQGLTALAAGAAALAPLAIGIKLAGDFEAVLLNIKKIAGDSADIPALSAAFIAMGPHLAMTAAQLGEIGVAAAQLGISSTKDITAFTEGVAMMAVALDVTTEAAGTASAKMLNIFKLPIEQIQNLGSAFNALSNTTAASAADIVNATFRASSTLASLGATAPQVSALAASLVSLGVPAEIAGSSLRRMFEMATTQPKKLSDAMGITVDDLQQRLGKDAVGTILQFLEKLRAVPNAAIRVGMATKIFGEEGSKAANLLSQSLDQTRKNIAFATAEFEKGTSIIQEFEAQAVGFNFSVKQMKSAFDALFVTLGTAVLPILTPIAKGIANVVAAFTKLIEPVKEVVAGVLGFVGAFLMATGSLILFRGALFALKGLMVIVGATFSGFIAIFAQAALVVGVLIASFYLLKRAFESNFGGFGDFLRGVFDKVSAFVQAVIEVFSSGEISGALYEELQRTGMLEFTEAVLRGFSRVKTFLSGMLNGFMAAWASVEPVAVAALTAIMEVFSALGQIVIALVNGFDSLFGGAGSQIAILEGVGKAGKSTGLVIGEAFATIAKVILLVITTLAKAGTAVLNFGTLVVNSVFGAINAAGDVISEFLSNIGIGIGTLWGRITDAARKSFEIMVSFFGGFFEGLQDGFSSAIPYIMALWDVMKDTAAVLLPIFAQILSGVGQIFAAMFGAGQDGTTSLTKMGAAGKLLGKSFGMTLSVIVQTLTTVTAGVLAVVQAIGIMANGIATVIAALAFLATDPTAALSLAWQSFVDAAFVVFEAVYSGIKEMFTAAGQMIVDIFTGAWTAVTDGFMAAFNSVYDGIKTGFISLAQTLVGAFAGPLESLKKMLADFVSSTPMLKFAAQKLGIDVGATATPAAVPISEGIKPPVPAAVPVSEGIKPPQGLTAPNLRLVPPVGVAQELSNPIPTAPGQNQEAGQISAPQSAPTPLRLVAPTAGMGNQDIASKGKVNATAATNNAIREAAAVQNDQQQPKDQTLVTQIVLDRRVVAESVNAYNSREGLRAGGIR